MENYGVSDFVGIFLIAIPLLVWLSVLLWWGLFQLLEFVLRDDERKENETNIYHHHYHYKDTKK